MTTPNTEYVLVQIRAEIIVKVPNVHPDAQATDGLNEGFGANPEFFVDWSFAENGVDIDAVVLDLDPDEYQEGDAWDRQIVSPSAWSYRRSQENGDNVDCRACGNPLDDNLPIVNDSEGYAYHEGCLD